MEWRRLGVAASVCLAVALSACTASQLSDADSRTARPDVIATSAPSSTPAVASDAPSDEPGPCDATAPAYPIEDEAEVEQLGGSTLVVPFDRGPLPYATGEAIANGQGVPIAYIVAENDVISRVGDRFCVGEQWIRWVNYVRRDGDALYVGDTLNLDAHTILSVGDQNGVVHNNELPEGFVIPPQR